MSDDSPVDHNDIDDIIHARPRPGVMDYLSAARPAVFGELRQTAGAAG